MKLSQAIVRLCTDLVSLNVSEDFKNNDGFWIRIFRAGQPTLGSGAWCATSVCWIIEQACYAAGRKKLPVRRFGGGRSARKLANRCLKFGRQVSNPLPGDIELRDRPGIGMHIEIVKQPLESGARRNFAGNLGGVPARFKEVHRSPHKFDQNHVMFIRLD